MATQQYKKAYEHFIPEAQIIPNYLDKCTHILVNTNEQLSQILEQNSDKEFCSFDLETTGLNPEEDTIVGYSFAFDAKTGYYVPVEHSTWGLGMTSLELIYNFLCKMKKIFLANVRFDMRFMEYAHYPDEEPGKIFDCSKWKTSDVLISAWLADTNIKTVNLKWASKYFCGIVQPTFAETLGDETNFYYLKPESCYTYATSDAICTYAVMQKTARFLKEAGFAGQLENQFMYSLMKAENYKQPIDLEFLKKFREELVEKLEKLENEIYQIIGYPFAINSGIQLGDALQSIGIHTNKFTAKGRMKVDIKTFELMIEQQGDEAPEILHLLIERSKTNKLITAYCDKLIKEGERMNGMARFGYKSNMVPSGRLAGTGDTPNSFFTGINIQAIPKPKSTIPWYVHKYNGEPLKEFDQVILGWRMSLEDKSNFVVEGQKPELNFRRAFPALPGYYIIEQDAMTQELRIMANIAHEENWIKPMKEGADLHKAMAIKMWGEENYTKEKRSRAKKMNFGGIYGLSAYSIQQQFGIPEHEAEDLYNRFWDNIPHIKAYQAALTRQAYKTGTVLNYFGFPRRVKFWLQSSEPGLRAFGRRTVMNQPVQSCGAVWTKVGILKWDKQYAKKWGDKVRFYVTVHDSVGRQVKICDNIQETHDIITDLASSLYFKVDGWELPIPCSTDIGNSWGFMFPFEYNPETKQWQPEMEEVKEETHETSETQEDSESEEDDDDSDDYSNSDSNDFDLETF